MTLFLRHPNPDQMQTDLVGSSFFLAKWTPAIQLNSLPRFHTWMNGPSPREISVEFVCSVTYF